MPAVCFFRDNLVAGGLMSRGPSPHDFGRRAAGYVDTILKGARPADLRVEPPIKFDLVINRKTANALGIALPPALLQQADEIIERGPVRHGRLASCTGAADAGRAGRDPTSRGTEDALLQSSLN